jgi:hypothetical protein
MFSPYRDYTQDVRIIKRKTCEFKLDVNSSRTLRKESLNARFATGRHNLLSIHAWRHS